MFYLLAKVEVASQRVRDLNRSLRKLRSRFNCMMSYGVLCMPGGFLTLCRLQRVLRKYDHVCKERASSFPSAFSPTRVSLSLAYTLHEVSSKRSNARTADTVPPLAPQTRSPRRNATSAGTLTNLSSSKATLSRTEDSDFCASGESEGTT